MPQMRLDKLLSHLNCGSRKEVQALIRAGRVSVDGTVQKDPAFKVDPDRSQTAVDGTVQRYRAQRYYMLNKPMGVITASRDERHDTVLELFPAELRRGLFAVGRLDKDTEGLLLLTDDGPLGHALLSPKRHVDKVYLARVDGVVDQSDVEALARGMVLGDGLHCLPAGLEPLEDGRVCLVTLREGKYHQVKRMMAARGKPVTYLKRLSMGPLRLDAALAPGEWRPLTREEVLSLSRFG